MEFQIIQDDSFTTNSPMYQESGPTSDLSNSTEAFAKTQKFRRNIVLRAMGRIFLI